MTENPEPQCTRCGGTQIDPEDSTEGQYGGWNDEPPALEPCRECVIRPGVLDRIRKHMKGPAGATLLDMETLLVMVDELQRERDAALSRTRGDAVDTWLKAQRNEQTTWSQRRALDEVLDNYRLHADTGIPLDQHACEGRCGGCATENTDVHYDPPRNPTGPKGAPCGSVFTGATGIDYVCTQLSGHTTLHRNSGGTAAWHNNRVEDVDLTRRVDDLEEALAEATDLLAAYQTDLAALSRRLDAAELTARERGTSGGGVHITVTGGAFTENTGATRYRDRDGHIWIEHGYGFRRQDSDDRVPNMLFLKGLHGPLATMPSKGDDH